MAFRTSQSLARQYETLKAFAAALRGRCLQYQQRMAAGSVPLTEINNELLPLLTDARSRFSSASSELAAYAASQEADPAYDLAAEFLAMRNAVIAAHDWLIANLPKNASNVLLERVLNADGTLTAQTVTSVQTATMQTHLLAIVGTIDP